MSTPALYDTLHSFKDIHNVVLGLADSLNDEQLKWKPQGYSTSIGFHLWHLARESDYLKAAILHHNPQFIPTEKRSGKRNVSHRNGAFPKDSMIRLAQA